MSGSSHERSSKIIVLRGPRYDTAHLCIPREPGNNARTPPWRAIEPSRASLFGRELRFRKWARTPLALLGHYADEDRTLDTAFHAHLGFLCSSGLLSATGFSNVLEFREGSRNINSAQRWLMRDPFGGRRGTIDSRSKRSRQPSHGPRAVFESDVSRLMMVHLLSIEMPRVH